jgi:quinol monooxygenase YgiN
LSIHVFVRFEPLAGKETEFREELLRVVEPTRTETGCVAMHVFESLREPFTLAIHSEWVDDAAFELHARLPHMTRFLAAAAVVGVSGEGTESAGDWRRLGWRGLRGAAVGRLPIGRRLPTCPTMFGVGGGCPDFESCGLYRM